MHDVVLMPFLGNDDHDVACNYDGNYDDDDFAANGNDAAADDVECKYG